MEEDRIHKFLRKLKTPSTIKGLLLLIGLIGYNIEPMYLNEIVGAVAVVYSAIAVLWQES